VPEKPGTSSAREAALVRAFVFLADTLVADYDVVDFLHELCDRCVEVLGVAAAGVLLADPQGQLTLVSASNADMRALEVFELQRAEGPCAEAYRDGHVVTVGDLSGCVERWPNFAPRAMQIGLRSALAVPISLRAQRIGALNLFATEPGRFEEADVLAARGLADVTAIGILQERAAREQEEVAGHLQHALDSRVLLEQAKGAISERLGVGPDEAFDLLRRYARPRGLKLSQVARDAVERRLSVSDLRAEARSSG